MSRGIDALVFRVYGFLFLGLLSVESLNLNPKVGILEGLKFFCSGLGFEGWGLRLLGFKAFDF